MKARFQDKVEERRLQSYTDLYQLMPANFAFTDFHCLGLGFVGVIRHRQYTV